MQIFLIILFISTMIAGVINLHDGILLCKNLWTIHIGLLYVAIGVLAIVCATIGLIKGMSV